MQKYLPTNDLLMKKMLTSEDSLHILKAFVTDLLGIEFKTLRPQKPYHIDSYMKSYDETAIFRTEVDILATSEDGSHTTIECQIQSHAYFHERVIFYLAEAFRSPFGNLETKEAEKKNNFSSLRPAYGINIVDFHLFNWKEPALQTFRLLNEETYQPFENRKKKELLVLCFLSLKNQNIDKKDTVYHWQYFLKTGEVKSDAPDYIKEAKRKTDFLTLEKEEQEMIMKIDKSKAIHDAVMEEVEETGIEKGIEKGIKIGIEKGVEKGRQKQKYNFAHKLLAEEFPIEKVSELTDLDIDLVKKLKKEEKK